MYVCTYVRTYVFTIYIYIYVYVYVYIHVHIYVHIHICFSVNRQPPKQVPIHYDPSFQDLKVGLSIVSNYKTYIYIYTNAYMYILIVLIADMLMMLRTLANVLLAVLYKIYEYGYRSPYLTPLAPLMVNHTSARILGQPCIPWATGTPVGSAHSIFNHSEILVPQPAAGVAHGAGACGPVDLFRAAHLRYAFGTFIQRPMQLPIPLRGLFEVLDTVAVCYEYGTTTFAFIAAAYSTCSCLRFVFISLHTQVHP